MRITTAWAEVSAQNVMLRLALAGSLLSSIAFAIGLVLVSAREPLIIERVCHTKALKTVASSRTKDEIEDFLRQTVVMRFNSEMVVAPGVLSEREEGTRRQEMDDFATRRITQRILLNSITLQGQRAKIDADRILSVGQVRSAFAFPLIVNFVATSRSEANPYGLVVDKVEPADERKGESK